MASKLFRAVVGLGISLGTASAACYGAIDDPQPGGGGVRLGADPPGTPSTGGGGSDARDGGASAEGAASDAGADVADSAILDAFCDATWPTTKANPSGPTCGATDGCKDSGPAPHCYDTIGPKECDQSSKVVPAWCVGAEWRCSTGAVTAAQCACWSGTGPCP